MTMPPKSKKVNLTKEEEINFVHEVRRRPILWDISLQEYSRSDLKHAVWEDVASAIGHFNEGESMQHRFKNMRDTFMSNYRKVKESKRSGAGADSVYVPKWYLYKELEFLEKTCTQARSTSNFNSESQSTTCSSSDSATLTILEKEMETFSPAAQTVSHNLPMYYDENLGKFMMIPLECETSNENISSDTSTLDFDCRSTTSCDAFVPPRPASAPATTVVGNHNKRKADQEEDEMYRKKGQTKKSGSALISEAINAFKEIAKQPLPELPTPEATDAFCSFIATRLRSLSGEQRKDVENKIMQVLMNI